VLTQIDAVLQVIASVTHPPPPGLPRFAGEEPEPPPV
jgi:hypothetical protein